MTCPRVPGLPWSLRAAYCLEWRHLGFVTDLEKQVLYPRHGEEVPAVGHSPFFAGYRETVFSGKQIGMKTIRNASLRFLPSNSISR